MAPGKFTLWALPKSCPKRRLGERGKQHDLPVDSDFPPDAGSEPADSTRASLASVDFQDYLSTMLIDFVAKTGAGGFAWDYTGFKDWRRKTDYDEWRGWHRILEKLRTAHPDIVMDHRQQCAAKAPHTVPDGPLLSVPRPH